jgi:DNA modification methylase
MAKKISGAKTPSELGSSRCDDRTPERGVPTKLAKPSVLLDTRVVYCGDNLEQLAKLPDACVDLIYIDPPFNSNRNYGPCRTGQCWGLPREITLGARLPHRFRHISRGETKEKRAFEDRHENTNAYIDYLRPRCVQLARVLKKTGSFYYHCDWHASHYVKVMLDQIFGENNFRNKIVRRVKSICLAD